MLKIQEYLQNNSLESLKEKFFIDYKRHTIYPNLVLLKYNQIESDFSNEMVRECRGIILDENDWGIICLTYTKFFNYGETNAAEINWNTAKVYEKIDGSLIQMFWYDNKWQIASSGSPDASGNVDIYDFNFANLFWKTWNELKYEMPTSNKDLCYAFELCTNYNKVVVQHEKSKIVLHGIRDRKTLEQFNIDNLKFHNFYELKNWEIVKTYTLKTLNDVIEFAKTLNPIHNEGFVVCDNNFNRIKIKSQKYVLLHHLKSSFSKDKLLEIIKTNENEEFLAYFQQYKEIFEKLKEKYYILISDTEEYWNKIKHIENRKEFAFATKECKFPDCMFKLKDKKYENVKAYMIDCRNEYILKIID